MPSDDAKQQAEPGTAVAPSRPDARQAAAGRGWALGSGRSRPSRGPRSRMGGGGEAAAAAP
jgi:hypothetical protein